MNILAINFGGIGDEIFFLPTLISLKKEFPNGYYVLPSSIHEVLIVDQSFVEEPLDLFALKEAVLEVNYQVVEPSEFLSNEVYEVKGPDFQLEKATFLNHKKEKNMER